MGSNVKEGRQERYKRKSRRLIKDGSAAPVTMKMSSHDEPPLNSRKKARTINRKEEDQAAIIGHNAESQSESESDDQAGNDAQDITFSTSAYQALLGSLQAKGGAFARVFAQRQKEEQGVSSSEEDDDNNDDGASEGDQASTEVEDSVDEDDGSGDITKNGLAHADHESPERASPMNNKIEKDDTSSLDEGEGGDGSHEESGSDEPSDSEASAGFPSDGFKKHLDYTLTDEEVAQLSKGQAKFKSETPVSDFPNAKWAFTASGVPVEEKTLKLCGVRKQLRTSWSTVNENCSWGSFLSHQQCHFFNLCNSYLDIMHSRRPTYYVEGDKADAEVMDAYLLHLLNHILKTRKLVTKNNNKMTRLSSSAANAVEVPRDQGFTRPKVLVLLPLRSSALRVVKRLIDLVPSSQKVVIDQEARFLDEFGMEDDASEDDLEAIKGKKTAKPADFQALFGGNNDDHFRMGIKFTRKSVKLYSDFYASDIIVASPLGLITRIGEAEHDKGKDVDFLSSIEILVIDYADVILMQNWSHVVEICEQLNRIPAQQHGTDFMRIREWFLNGQGRYYRQTILLSAFADAGMNAFFHRACYNFAGKVKLRCEYSGVLSKVVLQVRQVYDRVNCSSITEVDDARFEMLKKQVFAHLKDSFQSGVMIFVSSYFDFVRLRNFLKAENMSFCLLGEYTKQSDISRARAWFFHGKRQILLYTERAHFYHRYKIRGIKELIFYSLPEHAEFYAEITNMMEGLENPTSSIIFSQFDNLKLERVVGTSRANRMLKSENRTFMFC